MTTKTKQPREKNESYERFSHAMIEADVRRFWSGRPYPDSPFTLECWSAPRGILIAQVWERSGFSLYHEDCPPKTADCIAWALTKPAAAGALEPEENSGRGTSSLRRTALAASDPRAGGIGVTGGELNGTGIADNGMGVSIGNDPAAIAGAQERDDANLSKACRTYVGNENFNREIGTNLDVTAGGKP